MGRVIGYVRVSTDEQNLEMQIIAIERYAKDNDMEVVMYSEKISSRAKKREQLQNAIKAATEGDVFVVYKLDRLARSAKELYELTGELERKKVDFVSTSDKQVDTTTTMGKAMFGMMAVFAEFERDIIRERTKSGLEAARKRGKVGGRPKIDDKVKRQVKALYASGESAIDIAKEYGIGRSTIYKILNE